MKVGIGLRLSEAWRSHFEARPAAQKHLRTATVVGHDAEQSSDDGSMKKTLPPPTAVPTETGTVGYRDECITVDARQNKKGDWVLCKGAEQFDPKIDPAKVRKPSSILDPYCMVITRRFTRFGELESTLLEIQSRSLIQVLRQLVSHYSDETFRIGDTIKFEDPPRLLYYYRKELAEYKNRPDVDERTKMHIGFALNFLYSHIGEQIKQYEEFLAADMINFAHLWMMFRPGCWVSKPMGRMVYYDLRSYSKTPRVLHVAPIWDIR